MCAGDGDTAVVGRGKARVQGHRTLVQTGQGGCGKAGAAAHQTIDGAAASEGGRAVNDVPCILWIRIVIEYCIACRMYQHIEKESIVCG